LYRAVESNAVQMTKHQLHNALDELERKVVLEMEKSFEHFTISATEILNNLIELSNSHSKNILKSFKNKVVELRPYIDSITEIENDDVMPPAYKYLKLRPINELIEQKYPHGQEYDISENSQPSRKKQINSGITKKLRKQKNSLSKKSLSQDKRFYVYLHGSWIAGGPRVQVGPSRFVSNKAEIFKCPKCNYRFTDISLLQDHFCLANIDNENKNKNNSPKPFRCVKCNYKGRTQSDLSNHLNSKADCKQKFQCNTCSQRFRHSKVLNEHVNRVHRSNKQLQCFLCRERFENSKMLRNHYCPLLNAR